MTIFKRALQGPSPGLVQGDDGSFVRLVDRYAVYGDGLNFPDLCRKMIRPDTKYLVLDLDGTFHKRLNLGVFLGYELSAYQAYGLDYLLKVEEKRGLSPFVLKRRDAVGKARYVKIGATRWLVPGAIYYSLARLGWANHAVRRNLRRNLGPFAMDRLLALMRLGLMHQMASAPLSDVRLLVESLWRRYADLTVIEPEDIKAIRGEFSNLKIIVSSASPSVCLDVVREKYPVHKVINLEIEVKNGRTSTPHFLHPVFGHGKPARIAPPASLRENAAQMKIDRLVELYPDFLDPGVHTVGITDTKHGEDQSFAEAFKCVADVNSPDPFSPLVSARSPLREIHSARVFTRKERLEGQDGGGQGRILFADEMARILKSDFAAARKSAGTCYSLYRGARADLADFAERLDALETEIASSVEAYNQASQRGRNAALKNLRASVGGVFTANRRLSSALTPLSDAYSGLEEAIISARNRVH
ncbi:MAG: hypothetical protein HZB23_01185 [Deltaproteobacteria bacterium]|nr:hypothetical protein [Deltaproteobacteria bacterium]